MADEQAEVEFLSHQRHEYCYRDEVPAAVRCPGGLHALALLPPGVLESRKTAAAAATAAQALLPGGFPLLARPPPPCLAYRCWAAALSPHGAAAWLEPGGGCAAGGGGCSEAELQQLQAANAAGARRRMQSINDAFEGLRSHIPTLPYLKAPLQGDRSRCACHRLHQLQRTGAGRPLPPARARRRQGARRRRAPGRGLPESSQAQKVIICHRVPQVRPPRAAHRGCGDGTWKVSREVGLGERTDQLTDGRTDGRGSQGGPWATLNRSWRLRFFRSL